MLPNTEVANRVARAITASAQSQRAIARESGIAQAIISRIVDGSRAAKMPELLAISQACGVTLAELTGSAVSERVQVVARGNDESAAERLRQALLHYLELDAYLDDQAVLNPA